MALPAPTNLDATYEAITKDRVILTVYWDPLPGAVQYNLYRDEAKIDVLPDPITGEFELLNVEGRDRIVHRDIRSWDQGQSLDLFYWVSGVENVNGSLIEGEKAGPITNVHPFAIRTIEEVRTFLADDLEKVLSNKSIYEQLSTYHYKIAMDAALSEIAATPTPTPTLTYGNFPKNWKFLLILGTIVYVLPRIELLETAKQMQFSDQGQGWTPPDLSAKFAALRDHYNTMFKEKTAAIKHNVRPGPVGVGSLRALFLSPQLLKFRHLQSGRPYF